MTGGGLFPESKALVSVPGVGPLTAWRRSCSRWETNSALNPVRQWAATWDCGPRRDQSGSHDPQLGDLFQSGQCVLTKLAGRMLPTTSSGPSARIRRPFVAGGLAPGGMRGGNEYPQESPGGGGEEVGGVAAQTLGQGQVAYVPFYGQVAASKFS